MPDKDYIKKAQLSSGAFDVWMYLLICNWLEKVLGGQFASANFG